MNDFPLRPHVQTFLTNVVDFLGRLRMIMTYTGQHSDDMATNLVMAAAGVEAEMLISGLGPVERLNESEQSTVALPFENLKRLSAARHRILQKICSSTAGLILSPYSVEPKDDNKKWEEQLGHLGEQIGEAVEAVRDVFTPDFAEAGREIGEAVGAAADIAESYWGDEDRGDEDRGDSNE